ncbi:unannotated protein [freshwater metagenome]|uniref:Unannotated protein n=1 Tax=freshwater metagenome TaxID=449393 RepID=A0A6J6UVH7_9ZZZZ
MPAVDQLQAYLDLIEVILDGLVEATDLDQSIAAKAAVRALQVHKRISARVHVLVKGAD